MPPVTALRSPPDSRITGALSPVITDSSTVAMPSITSPSPGIRSPASQITTSPARSCEAGTCLDLAVRSEPLRHRVRLGLAQRVGLRLAARFRHRLGEVGEQHREPEPQRDLKLEADLPRRRVKMSRIRNTVVSAAPTSTTNITGFFSSVTGFSFTNESRVRALHDLRVEQRTRPRQLLGQQRRRIVLARLGGCSVGASS